MGWEGNPVQSQVSGLCMELQGSLMWMGKLQRHVACEAYKNLSTFQGLKNNLRVHKQKNGLRMKEGTVVFSPCPGLTTADQVGEGPELCPIENTELPGWKRDGKGAGEGTVVCTSERTKAVAGSLGPWVIEVGSLYACFRKRFQLLNTSAWSSELSNN